MAFTFQTVLMTVLCSNLLIICMVFIFRHQKLMLQMGYRVLQFGLCLIIVRLLLPVEFSFTRNINLNQQLSYLITAMNRSRWGGFSLWEYVCIIWCAGIAVSGLYHFYKRRKSYRFLRQTSLQLSSTHPCVEILRQICQDNSIHTTFQLFENEYISSPLIYGFFQPTILLPRGLTLTPDEWTYVLKHEIAHFRNKDLWVKFLLELLCIVYWWNPACYQLKKQVDIIIEVRIDHKVTGSRPEQNIYYFECILNISRQMTQKRVFSCPEGIYFCRESKSLLKYRMEMSLGKSSDSNRALIAAIVILMLAIYVSSHIFIFESVYLPPDIRQTCTSTLSSDMYYIKDKTSDMYQIYLKGYYIESTNSLEHYIGIRAYDKEIHPYAPNE